MIVGDDNNEDQKLYRGAYYLKPVIKVYKPDIITTYTPSWFHINAGYDPYFNKVQCNVTGFTPAVSKIRLLVEAFTLKIETFPYNKYVQAYAEVGGAWSMITFFLSKIVVTTILIYTFIGSKRFCKKLRRSE